jgi:hypothetical protein
VAHTPVILATQEAEIRRIAAQSQSLQIVHKTQTLSQKSQQQKRAGWMAQVVGCLPGKREALSSTLVPPTRRKKKRKEKKE